MLRFLGDLKGRVLHVEGPHRLWLKKKPVLYYSLTLLSDSATADNGEGELSLSLSLSKEKEKEKEKV